MNNNKRSACRNVLVSTLFLVAFSTGALAANEAAATLSGQAVATQRPIREIQELDEVLVRGQATANMIIDVENVLFRLYNQVERNDDYRITCGDGRLNPGSVIMTRICAPGFFSRYVSPPPVISSSPCDGGYFVNDQLGYSPPGGCSDAGAEPLSVDVILMTRDDKWGRHMNQTIKSDPRLYALANRAGELQSQMAELQSRYLQIKREKRAAERAVKGTEVRANAGPRT